MIALANAVNGALDHALGLGAQLEELSSQSSLDTPVNRPLHRLPAAVERALARLPRPHPLDRPIGVLRNGMQRNGRADRLAQLVADGGMIDV